MESKKKVLVFIPEFPVLTETFIERELSKLVERDKLDIVVYSLKKGVGEVSDILKPRIVYKRLGKLDAVSSLLYALFHPGKVRGALRLLSEESFLSKRYVLLKSIGYAKRFSQFKPDFILAHFLSEPSTIVMCASNIMGVPYGISAHARDVTVDSQYVDEKIETAKFITICNKNAYEYLLESVGEGNKSNIKLSYHGIDAKVLVESISDINLIKNKPLILSIGRLVEKKGLSYLINASKILKDRAVDHLIYIIGKGPLYEVLHKQITDLGLEEYVKILGDNKGLSNREVLSYLKVSDVFAFPSIETDEGDVDGIANVLLEAGVFGVPVVATDSGSTGELILNEDTGLVCSQKNSDMLASCIERVLRDFELSRRMGDGLKKKVSDEFDLDKRILDLESLLIANY